MGRLIDADTCQYYDGYGDRLDKAIEIVKRGGRDEKQGEVRKRDY